jgi:predicted nuclease of predicted toxin-antitoxin system
VRLKLDENLSRHLKATVAAFGHVVTGAADEGLLSQPDTVVAAAAAREDRVLLTLDLEFGDLRKYPPGSHPGIVLFRPRTFGPRAVNRFIETFLRDTDLTSLARCVVIVEPSRVRVRRPPLRTDTAEWTEFPN